MATPALRQQLLDYESRLVQLLEMRATSSQASIYNGASQARFSLPAETHAALLLAAEAADSGDTALVKTCLAEASQESKDAVATAAASIWCDGAIEAARSLDFPAAVQHAQAAELPLLIAHIRDAVDPYVYRQARQLLLAEDFDALDAQLRFVSSDRVYKEMEKGLDLHVFELAHAKAKEGAVQAARKLVGCASTDEVANSMRGSIPALAGDKQVAGLSTERLESTKRLIRIVPDMRFKVILRSTSPTLVAAVEDAIDRAIANGASETGFAAGVKAANSSKEPRGGTPAQIVNALLNAREAAAELELGGPASLGIS